MIYNSASENSTEQILASVANKVDWMQAYKFRKGDARETL